MSGTTYLAVGQSAFGAFDETAATSYPTRIKVEAGDVLGIGLAANAGSSPPSCFDPNGGPGDAERGRGSDVPPGTSQPFPSGPFPVRLNVVARLEPDQDGDGFGDESQDGCPSSALSQAGCPIGGLGGRDTKKPGVKVRAKGTQSLLKKSSLSVVLRPTEAVKVTGGGSISVPGASKRLSFKRVKRSLRANKSTRVRLKLSPKKLRAVRRALRGGRRLKAKIRLTLTDAAGNRTRVRRTIKVRG